MEVQASFNVSSQALLPKRIQLVLDTCKFIIDHCFKNNLLLKRDYDFNPEYDYKINKVNLLVFTINYNDFDYIYIIRKVDNRLTFKIKLKRNKVYRINLYDPSDFLHMLNCMYNDK